MSDTLTTDDIDPQFSTLISAFTGKQGERGERGRDGSPGATGAAGAAGTGLVYPDLPPVSPNAMDDEFNAGTLDAKWTSRNFSTTTTTFPIASWIALTPPANSGDNMRILTQTAPAAQNYSILAKCSLTGARTNFDLSGIIFDNGTGFYILGFEYPSQKIKAQRWTNVTTFSAELVTSPDFFNTHAWFKADYNLATTEFTFWYSSNGIGFQKLLTFTDTLTVTAVGLYVMESNNTGITVGYCDYFRRVA